MKNTSQRQDIQLFYRLTALWVICEAFAGGVFHAVKMPFTGMIVSSLAITCIILIAYYFPTGSAVIKATIIVAVFKLMLSPHSPPTAYIAVFFQGILGNVLLQNRNFFRVGAIILGILGLVESSIQRILVLLILYGSDFWNAVNVYVQKLLHVKEATNYSFILATIYVILHGVAGLLVGIFAARLAQRSEAWPATYPQLLLADNTEKELVMPGRRNKRKKIKWLFVFLWLILLVMYVHAFVVPAKSVLPANAILNILLRSVLIILTWWLAVSPMFMWLLKRSLRSQENRLATEITGVMQLLPQTNYIFRKSFSKSAVRKGTGRIKMFFRILLVNVLRKDQP